MDSQSNRKIQYLTVNICGYKYRTEYGEGKKNVCAHMLPHFPLRLSDSNDSNELSDPNITDKIFEVSMVNSGKINSMTSAQHNLQITDNQCIKKSFTSLVKIW